MIRVTVWNENIHEKEMPEVARVYPQGIHGAIAQAVGVLDDVTVRTVTMDMPEHGLTQEVLDQTDVLLGALCARSGFRRSGGACGEECLERYGAGGASLRP